MIAVEVRQETLGVDGRGLGPAGNSGRGWSWLRSGEKEEEKEEKGEKGEKEEKQEEKQATNIKSNNPHLAGGEKNNDSQGSGEQ